MSISIPQVELEFTFSRSSGPGGQNVNKVNSRATLKWHIFNASTIREDIKQRFLDRYGNTVNSEGFVVIHSDKTRDQHKNKQDCIDKLYALLETVERPPKKRVATKRSYGQNQNRLAKKRAHSDKKSNRRWSGDD